MEGCLMVTTSKNRVFFDVVVAALVCGSIKYLLNVSEFPVLNYLASLGLPENFWVLGTLVRLLECQPQKCANCVILN